MGGSLFLAARTAAAGTELWRINKADERLSLVADLAPGAASSNPLNLTTSGSTLYFSANGDQLWRVDGASGSPSLVADLPDLGGAPGSLHDFALLGSTLYLVDTGTNGDSQIWKSDGTGAGTSMVQDFPVQPGASNSSGKQFLSHPMAYHDSIIFEISVDVGAFLYDPIQIWSTKGTAASTKRLFTTEEVTYDRDPNHVLIADDLLLISTSQGSASTLYRSDGTASGTFKVGSTGGIFQYAYPVSTGCFRLAA